MPDLYSKLEEMNVTDTYYYDEKQKTSKLIKYIMYLFFVNKGFEFESISDSNLLRLSENL
jgi:hypothetical protein